MKEDILSTVNGFCRLLALTSNLALFSATVEAKQPLIREFLGLNVHTIQFKPDLFRPVSHLVRDYHPVHWDLEDNTSILPDFPISKNKVDWEKLYSSWEGFDIDVCLMFESIERDKWTGLAKDAETYGREFARQFGPSGKSPLVRSVEIGNEPGTWTDDDFSTIFRAMATGVRTGDPKLKIATCNLTTGPSTSYEKSVDCLKGMLHLVDILCVHTYPMLELYPTWRRSYPEDPKLLDYLQLVENLARWRDANAPDKPIWITEFGYDSSTKPPPSEGTFSKWMDVTDEQHAQWLVRSILIFSTMAVERAYIYYFNDADEPQFHASSGLTRNDQPKAAYHAVANLQKSLGDYRFRRIVVNEAGNLRVQEYEHEKDPNLLVWVAWSPTGEGRAIEWKIPNAPGKLLRQERMPFAAELMNDSAKIHATESPGSTVSVTESPLYLFFQKT